VGRYGPARKSLDVKPVCGLVHVINVSALTFARGIHRRLTAFPPSKSRPLQIDLERTRDRSTSEWPELEVSVRVPRCMQSV
jgi:hypothetical protein